MRDYVLFDNRDNYSDLLPLSFTRPLSDIRVGALTLRSKWEIRLPGQYHYQPVEYLTTKFGQSPSEVSDLTFICGTLLPDDDLVKSMDSLKPGEALRKGDDLLGFRGTKADFDSGLWSGVKEYSGDVRIVRYPYDVFRYAEQEISVDFALMTKGRKSKPLSSSVTLLGKKGSSPKSSVFIEEGADVECCVLDVREGPIYIGKDATVMPGVLMRGPVAVDEHAVVKMGAKVYGGTAIGPWCKVGGEISNVVFFGYSNKAHDGYLGNAVIGEWCNLGAGVNSSNLKNDYSKIRLWNYRKHSFLRTDLQFCGLIMGDHSKAGINVMFNTATVVGVGCNVYGAGFPRVFIPSFSQGSPASGLEDVPLKKFYEVAERVMSRRGITLSDGDRRIYERVYEVASRYK